MSPSGDIKIVYSCFGLFILAYPNSSRCLGKGPILHAPTCVSNKTPAVYVICHMALSRTVALTNGWHYVTHNYIRCIRAYFDFSTTDVIAKLASILNSKLDHIVRENL